MPNYLRPKLDGHTWFFTVVTHARQPLLVQPPVRLALRQAITTVRTRQPFNIDAWVLLPDHMHCIWTLPQGDQDFSLRWSAIKRLVAQRCGGLVDRSALPDSMRSRGEIGFWQRRFWEHAIRDERDLDQHLDYIHYNPVKHGFADQVTSWPHSTFHRLVREGLYAPDWGDFRPDPGAEFGE